MIYCASTKKLWDEVEERYGLRIGPQLYLQHNICSIQQGSDTVTVLYSKLLRAWDEKMIYTRGHASNELYVGLNLDQ